MRTPGPILCLTAALGLLAPLGAAELAWVGRVVDENETPVSGAVVTVRPASVAVPSGGSWQARTDPTGVFSISLPEAGDYLVGVECAGYYALHDQRVHLSDNPPETTLAVAKVREVFQSVDVNERPSPVDVAETRNQERLTGTVDLSSVNLYNRLEGLARYLLHNGGRVSSMAQGRSMAQGSLYQQLLQQSTMLAYLDVIKCLAIAMALAIPLVFLMKRPKKGAAPVGH